jgi:hypothetical protein
MTPTLRYRQKVQMVLGTPLTRRQQMKILEVVDALVNSA